MNRLCPRDWQAGRGDSHGMLVVHDRQELVHWQHLSKRISSNQLLCSSQRDGIAQRPVGIVSFHQIYHIGHCFLWLFHLHPLPTNITKRKWVEEKIPIWILHSHKNGAQTSESWDQLCLIKCIMSQRASCHQPWLSAVISGAISLVHLSTANLLLPSRLCLSQKVKM